jgi:hypothetical protein
VCNEKKISRRLSVAVARRSVLQRLSRHRIVAGGRSAITRTERSTSRRLIFFIDRIAVATPQWENGLKDIKVQTQGRKSVRDEDWMKLFPHWMSVFLFHKYVYHDITLHILYSYRMNEKSCNPVLVSFNCIKKLQWCCYSFIRLHFNITALCNDLWSKLPK